MLRSFIHPEKAHCKDVKQKRRGRPKKKEKTTALQRGNIGGTGPGCDAPPRRGKNRSGQDTLLEPRPLLPVGSTDDREGPRWALGDGLATAVAATLIAGQHQQVPADVMDPASSLTPDSTTRRVDANRYALGPTAMDNVTNGRNAGNHDHLVHGYNLRSRGVSSPAEGDANRHALEEDSEPEKGWARGPGLMEAASSTQRNAGKELREKTENEKLRNAPHGVRAALLRQRLHDLQLQREEALREVELAALLIDLTKLHGQDGKELPCGRRPCSDDYRDFRPAHLPPSPEAQGAPDELIYREEATIDNFVGSHLAYAPLPRQAQHLRHQGHTQHSQSNITNYITQPLMMVEPLFLLSSPPPNFTYVPITASTTRPYV